MWSMKKKLLLIGGGTIATHYKAGLLNSPLYELVGLCELNPDCAARQLNEALATSAALPSSLKNPCARVLTKYLS